MKEKNTKKMQSTADMMGQGHSKTALDLMILFTKEPDSTFNPLNQNYMHFNLDIYSGLEPIFI